METSCPWTPSPAVSPTLKQLLVSSIQQPCWHDLSPLKSRVDATPNDKLINIMSALAHSRHWLLHCKCLLLTQSGRLHCFYCPLVQLLFPSSSLKLPPARPPKPSALPFRPG